MVFQLCCCCLKLFLVACVFVVQIAARTVKANRNLKAEKYHYVPSNLRTTITCVVDGWSLLSLRLKPKIVAGKVVVIWPFFAIVIEKQQQSEFRCFKVFCQSIYSIWKKNTHFKYFQTIHLSFIVFFVKVVIAIKFYFILQNVTSGYWICIKVYRKGFEKQFCFVWMLK